MTGVSETVAEPEKPVSTRVFLSIFSALALPIFIGVLDQTIVATALPSIAGEFGEVERVSWVVVSYLVASTIGAAIYGRLGDSLGRKRLMFGGLCIFMVASALCALAPNIEFLTLARLLQGLGAGGLYTLSQALLGETVPILQRVRYQGYLATVGLAALSIGPLAGGLLTDHFGWRSIFAVNIPLGLIAIAILKPLRARRGTGGEVSFDWAGMVLFSTFIGPALIAMEQIRHVNARTLPETLALLAVAAISLPLLLRQEKRAPMPLFPLGLLGERTMWRCSVLGACHGAAMVSLLTFVPIYLRVVRGESATSTGILILPLAFLIPLGSMMTSRLMTLTGRTADIPSWGLAIPTLVLAAVGLWGPHLATTTLSGAFGLAALGLSTGMTVAQVIVQIVGGSEMMGISAASVQIARSVGAAFGTAAVAAILFALLASAGPENLALFARLLEEGPAVMDTLPAAHQALMRQLVGHAFGWAFMVMAAFTLVSMIVSWTIPSRRL